MADVGRRGIALCALLLAPAAQAAPPPEAKAHFDAGTDYFAKDRFDDAIREFQIAYDLSGFPELLINIARAHSHLGHEEESIAFLERYLKEKPDAIDAASVRAEIDARRRALDATRAAAAANRAAAAAQHKPAPAPRPKSRARLIAPGAVVLALGLALVTGGLLAGAQASSESNTVAGGGDPKGGSPVDFSSQGGRYVTAQKSGQRDAAAGAALDVIGGLAIAAGIVALVVVLRPHRADRVHSATVSQSLEAAAGSGGLRWSF